MSDTKTPTAGASSPAPTGSADNRAKLLRLLVACEGLMEIVEGCLGRRWAADGTRLVDTKEWCEFYVAQRAVCAAADASLRPNAQAEPRREEEGR